MGSGSIEAVLAADINSLIQNPIVLFGAAAIVVVAVVVVLVMVLRGGGSKKNLMAGDYEGEEAGWSAPQRSAAPQSGRNRGSSDQALPWEQGGRGDDGRQPAANGRRPGRSGQDWGQSDYAGQRDQGWGNQAPARGGQDAGDQWGQPEPAMGGGFDRRNAQGQGSAWSNAGDQAAGGWGNDGWGQAPAANAPAARGNDGWGQAPAANAPAARGGDEWGAARNDDQWGQGQQGRGRQQNQWEQQDPWGQPAQAPNRAGDPWEQQSAPPRGARSGGMEAPAQAGGQAKNAGWGAPAANSDWEQTVQPQRPAQPSRNSRPAANDWGQPAQDTADEWGKPAPNGAGEWGQPAAGGWGGPDAAASAPEPAAPAWQAPSWGQAEPEQPPRSRSGSWGQQPPSTSRPQRSQPEQPAADDGWASPGVADHWGQSGAPSPARNSRPMGQEPARQPAPAYDAGGGSEWGMPEPDRAGSAQPDVGWGVQEAAPAWQAPEAPARQAPPARQGPNTGPVPPTSQRNMPDLAGVSPESTAYSPAKSTPDSDGEVTKTVVMRKDNAGGERVPGVVVRQGKEAGRTYEMRRDTLRIGRSRESDIFLEDLAVSRLHATIYRDEMGTIRLRDEHSANGTTVNGQRIFAEHTLQEGDEIQLGTTILAFVRR